DSGSYQKNNANPDDYNRNAEHKYHKEIILSVNSCSSEKRNQSHHAKTHPDNIISDISIFKAVSALFHHAGDSILCLKHFFFKIFERCCLASTVNKYGHGNRDQYKHENHADSARCVF